MSLALGTSGDGVLLGLPLGADTPPLYGLYADDEPLLDELGREEPVPLFVAGLAYLDCESGVLISL